MYMDISTYTTVSIDAPLSFLFPFFRQAAACSKGSSAGSAQFLRCALEGLQGPTWAANTKTDVPCPHDGSMVLPYMDIYGVPWIPKKYTPFMLAYIPAPWILWGRV